MNNPVLRVGVAALLAATPAAAQEPAPAPPPAVPPAHTVRLALDLGFVNAAGNTDVTTFSFAETFEVKASRWSAQEFASTVYGRSRDSTTAEQIKAGGRLDLKLISVLHAFVGVIYERNRFAGIARRFEEYAGLAVRVIDRPATLWTLEVGSSLNQQRNTLGTDLGFAAGRVATQLRHNFTRATYVEEKAEILPNLDTMDDLRVNSETTVVAPISSRVALKLLYAVKFDNLPELGFDRTDRVFTTAVQIVF